MKRQIPAIIGQLVMALASLALLVWVLLQVLRAPSQDVRWSLQTGIVNWIDEHGPAAGRLYLGDRVLAIDGKPLIAIDLLPLLAFRDQTQLTGLTTWPTSTFGDRIALDVLHNGNHAIVALPLEPQSLRMIVRRMTPLLVALLFWMLGLALILFSPRQQNRLAFLFTQAAIIMLASCTASCLGLQWFATLFYIMLWWLGPLVLLFHVNLTRQTNQPWLQHLVWIANTCAALGSVLELISAASRLETSWWGINETRLVWVIAVLASVLAVLVSGYWKASTRERRRQITLLISGNALAVLPVALLYFLPPRLAVYSGAPFENSMLAFSCLPLTYSYAIFRHQLLPITRHVNRQTVTLLLWILLGGAYGALVAATLSGLSPAWRQHPLIITALILLALVVIRPSHRYIQRWLDQQLYGGWYDYQTLLQRLSQTLRQGAKRTALVQSLCEVAQRTLHLEWAAILLTDKSGALTLAGEVGVSNAQQLCFEHGSPLYSHFQQHLYPLSGEAIQARFAPAELPAAERYIITQLAAQLWIPLTEADRLHGILVIGPKHGNELVETEDYAILQLIAQQASMALRNLELVDELRQQAADKESLYHQILLAREDERASIARELHDQVIQDLIGLNYSIAQTAVAAPSDIPERLLSVQEQLRQMIVTLRTLCGKLRPPALDQLGLVGVLRERLRVLQETTSIQTRLIVEGDETLELPPATALCLFRVAQEALSNVTKHARANRVVIGLTLTPQEVWLTITDDGLGFQVPAHLDRLLDEQHFGLIGLRERLELIHGAVDIVSAIGHGTQVRAWAPLEKRSVLS